MNCLRSFGGSQPEKSPPIESSSVLKQKLDSTEQHRLMGKGLGYIDVHLLASALLSNGLLWTKDKRLKEAAKTLNIAGP
jgi:hypothetical protein